MMILPDTEGQVTDYVGAKCKEYKVKCEIRHMDMHMIVSNSSDEFLRKHPLKIRPWVRNIHVCGVEMVCMCFCSFHGGGEL
jgi:hypothetical protein